MNRARLTPLSFPDLAGWADDDHAGALAAFRRGADVVEIHPPKARSLGTDAEALGAVLRQAAAFPVNMSRKLARNFFETEFSPFEVAPENGAAFFTGYYEPEVEGSLVPTAVFRFPLYRPPDHLVEIEPGSVAGLPADFRFAGRTPDGYAEHFDRGAVMSGALAEKGLELVWLRDPVDAFFIHVQGAARIILPDGKGMRVTYAAKSGHPYTAIGRVLVERGELTREKATMQGIRAWLATHPGEADAVMAANRSYIYFRVAPVADPALGPVAAAKVPLTPGRSLALDRLVHAFHTPVWVDTTAPSGDAIRALMIAQDTGSAIIGAARGDIFFGSGESAADIAGAMRAGGRFVVLVPRTRA